MPRIDNSFSVGGIITIGLAVIQLLLIIASLGYGAAQINQNKETIRTIEKSLLPELSKEMQSRFRAQDVRIANNLEIVSRTQGFTGRLEERMEALQRDINQLNANLRRILNE